MPGEWLRSILEDFPVPFSESSEDSEILRAGAAQEGCGRWVGALLPVCLSLGQKDIHEKGRCGS